MFHIVKKRKMREERRDGFMLKKHKLVFHFMSIKVLSKITYFDFWSVSLHFVAFPNSTKILLFFGCYNYGCISIYVDVTNFLLASLQIIMTMYP